MFLSNISIKRPIMISMFLIVFVLFGSLAYFGMDLELTPEVDLPIVIVQTIYAGAGPKELETQVTKKIEDAIASISGIDYIQSYSMENISLVMIGFEMGKEVNLGINEVKDKIDWIVNDLPADAELPVVQKFDINALPIVNLILTGPQPVTELYDYTDRYLKDRLSQISGVANIQVTGEREREIRVELDNRTVLQHSISLPRLAQILASQNMDMPGGNFRLDTQDYSVRLNGEFQDLGAINDLEVPTSGGMRKLEELAKVIDTGADVTERTTYFDNIAGTGDNSVIQLGLVKATDGNAVSIYRDLSRSLPEIQKTLPPGCSLELAFELATFIDDSVKDTLLNILLGVILTSLVLLFFLHDYKSTIIVGLSMPMSIISSFMFMKLSGFSLNILSLMGLSTAVGILVTNSVVVLENIFRHKEMGRDKIESAASGTSEITMAVIASASTNLVVFLPLASMSSIAGQFFQQFCLTVVFATIFSVIMSFTLTPMLASRILPEHDRKKHPFGNWLEKIFKSWESSYRKSIEWLLENGKRGMFLLAVSVLIFMASLMIGKNIGFEFIPSLDEGTIEIQVELPVGYKLDETASVMETIEDRVKKYDEVSHFWTTLGQISDSDIGSNLSLMTIKLKKRNERLLSTDEVNDLLIKDLSDIPNARIRPSTTNFLFSGRSDIEFYLLGQDLDSLAVFNHEMLDGLKDIPGVVNLTSSHRAGKPEIAVLPDRHKMAEAGITVSELAYALRSSIDGMVTTYFKDRGEEYDIRVVMTDETVNSPEKIGSVPVVGPNGTFRLEQLSDITYTEGYSKILHRNRYKAVEVKCDVAPGFVMGDIMKDIDTIAEKMNLPEGYDLKYGLVAEEMGRTTRDIAQAFIIAIILTYMLLAAILESLTQPLLILGTIPLALIGVFLALAITGMSMNIISMLAIVMLVGIVVNNAILQLDYANILIRQNGASVHEALIEACPTKLKPIIMSSLAIVLGMLPLAIGIGASGSEIRQPMGVVAIGGTLASTLLSLFIIPVFYNLVSRKSPQHVTAVGQE